MGTISGHGTSVNVLGNTTATWDQMGNAVLDVPDLALETVLFRDVTSRTSETLVVCTNDLGEMSSLPLNATILGITVTIFNTSTDDATLARTTYTVTPVKDTSAAAWGLGETAKTGAFPATNGNITLGGAADLWGMTGLTPTLLRGNAWGFSIVVANSHVGTQQSASLDAVQYTVTYTAPSAGAATSMRSRLPGRRNRSTDK